MKAIRFLLLPAVLFSQAPAQSVPVYARNGMVSTAEPNATAAGVEILKAGGNAFDAAAAVGFALAVTYPQAGNLGGGGFMLALARDSKTYALDFRETAPAAATRDMFLDAKGEVAPDRSTKSHLAAGVPGTVDGLLAMHGRFGKLPRDKVLQHAIRLAGGFRVSYGLSRSLRSNSELMTRFASTRAVFYPGGKELAMEAVLKQPDLAKTLQRISKEGRGGFYAGETARLIVEEMRRGGGIITGQDLAGYRSKWRDPFVFRSGPYELVTMPLPSSGGVTLAQILGLVDLDALKRSGWNSSEYIHRLTEAERLAYADRNTFLADPDFVQVPVARLTSPEYLSQRRALLPTGKAGESKNIKPGNPEREETTHYCVADKEGNVVAITYTLNGSYGMGAVVEGAGFLLNNEMDDFTSKPGVPNLYGLVQSDANAIQPGKRMLSSMTPIIVRRNGQFAFTVGSPGGSTIITTVLQVFLNMTLWDMDIRSAIDAPRFHHQWLPDEIAHEAQTISADTGTRLEAMGYKLRERAPIGIACGIAQRDGVYRGWSDRRGEGLAAGY